MLQRLDTMVSDMISKGEKATDEEWKSLSTCAGAAKKALGDKAKAIAARCEKSWSQYKSDRQVVMLKDSLTSLEKLGPEALNDGHAETFLRAWAADAGALPDDMADKMADKVCMLVTKLAVTIPTLKMEVWSSFCDAVKEAVEASGPVTCANIAEAFLLGEDNKDVIWM